MTLSSISWMVILMVVLWWSSCVSLLSQIKYPINYVPPLRIELRIFSLRGSSFNHSAIEAFNCTEGRIWTHYLMDISHLHLPLVLPQHYKLKGCGRDSNPISSFTVKHFYQISYPHSSDNRTWTYNYCLMRAAFYLLKYIRILSWYTQNWTVIASLSEMFPNL